MQKRLYVFGLLLAAAGCVGDWSQAREQDAARHGSDEAGVQPTQRDADLAQEDADAADAAQSATDAARGADAIVSDTTPQLDGAADDASPIDADGTWQEAAANGEDASEGDAEASAQDASPDAVPPARTAAIASVDSPCSVPVELACSAHNVAQKLVCLNAKWTFNGSCDGATRCDTRFGVSQGTCQAITTRCVGKEPGAVVCDGSARKSCGSDLLDELPNACPARAHCEGAGSCVCDRGYMSDASGCVDIPDCTAGACSNGQCVDGTETFRCTCNTGFRPAADQKSCEDVPDCKPGICGEGGTCVEGLNDYSCTCASGYEKKPGQKACSNIDNCVGNPCVNGTCHDGVNGYSCSCTPGYELFTWDGVNYLCVHPCEVPCACGGCSG